MKYYLAIFFFLCFVSLFSQTDTLPSYFVDNQEVVLEFDLRKYEAGQENEFSKIFEMSDVDVLAIIKSNDTWSHNGWHLKRINENIYQLRKSLDSFNDPLPWEAKYLINVDFWNSPTSEAGSQFDSTFVTDIYELDRKLVTISDNGNTTFILPDFTDAKKVILTGSFNKWNEQEIAMRSNKSGWTITLDLPEGIYEYKFIVDGKWMHDPNNSMKILNEHDTWNSILLIGEKVSFSLPDHLDAKEVILAGSFNNWNEQNFKMKKQLDGWHFNVPLPPGKHYYKFIVDGQWIVDPNNKLQQHDRNGYVNSVLLIH